jgi:nucleoid-associated protein YgaU
VASSEIIIKELAGRKRTLRLVGAGLPKRGANWPGKQRLVTTWYPGNVAQASQQVIGPIEAQSQWSGEWNTTRLVRSPAIYEEGGSSTKLAFAHSLALVLEDIFRSGVLLEVTWAVDNENPFVTPQQISRQGRASDWDFAYDRIDDIVWKVTWDWIGRGLGQDRVALRNDGAATQSLNSLDLVLLAVDESVNNTQIQLTRRTIPRSANTFSLEQLDAMLDAPSKLMRDFAQSCNRISNRVRTLGDLIGKAANLPFKVTNQAIDIATSAVQSAIKFYDDCTRTPPDYYDTQQRLGSLTRAASYFKGGLDSSMRVAREASNAREQFRATQAQRAGTGLDGKGTKNLGPYQKPHKHTGGEQMQTDVYIVRPGDTLIGISQRFYGMPDGAADIAYANNLSLKTATPPVGKVLIIPPYKGIGAIQAGKAKPPIKPASSQNPTLPNGIGQQYPYTP